MPTELSIRAVHIGGMRMTATNGEHAVTADYPLAAGERAITQSERLCPVWAMLAVSAPIRTSMTMIEAG